MVIPSANHDMSVQRIIQLWANVDHAIILTLCIAPFCHGPPLDEAVPGWGRAGHVGMEGDEF